MTEGSEDFFATVRFQRRNFESEDVGGNVVETLNFQEAIREQYSGNVADEPVPSMAELNVAQVYAAGTGERKEYAGTLPLCNKCKFHHNGPCTVKCSNCKRVGHLTRDCWSSAATNNQRTLTCYECGNQGHYRSDCPELKNGNQAGGAGTSGIVLALVGGENNQDLDDMEDDTNA
ncbi:reverse transcriptase domain-containing protein [Tanacetum coccineum]